MTKHMQLLPSRRAFIGYGLAAAGMGALGVRPADAAERFQIVHSDAEWRRLLSPSQYAVLREQQTERAGSSPLSNEHRPGIYLCAGCALPLFSSRTKFESGTGWPSFYAPLPRAIGTRISHELVYPRTEVHCRRCGGHLGHVFNDGPRSTGKRYCMNGLALTFRPA